MTMTLAYTEHLSETWLLERTYHAHLRNGRELSVPDLTSAMKQISTFSVPLSTWQEISQEEAHAAYQEGIPILLYGEHSWEHLQGATRAWSPNRHMRAIIYGTDVEQPEAVAGTWTTTIAGTAIEETAITIASSQPPVEARSQRVAGFYFFPSINSRIPPLAVHLGKAIFKEAEGALVRGRSW